MTKKRISSFIVALLSVVLSGCVTQEFESDETPVVKNQANRDDMAATRISLGLGYLKMGNMPQAKQNLEKAKHFSPKMVQVYTAFAHYYEVVGEHESTIASFEEALSLQNDDANTLNNYGVYLCRQNQLEAAEKQLLKAIAVPTYLLVAKSYENLSSCFLQKNKFIKAEMYLHKAVMHSPGNSSILFQMVRLQYAMGKYTEAKTYQQRFEKVTRRFTPESLALAYKVYWKLGQRRTAKNYGTMLVKMYPQSWESQQYLLNELELIEADSLAKRYQLTQMSEVASKSTKRVVKLSPKKAISDNTTNKPNIAKTEVANPQALQINRLPAPVTTKATVAASSTATSATINAALTMGSIEELPPVSETKLQEIEKLPDNLSEEDKRVVVLMLPEMKKEGEIKALTANDIPLADKEIFNTAKKPDPIIENAAPVEAPLTSVSTQVKQHDIVSNKPIADKASEDKSPEFHLVVKGDTLYSISIKYNIKIRALRRWNNLTGNRKIRLDDKLHLTDPKTVTK